jgi:hypothetical protein
MGVEIVIFDMSLLRFRRRDGLLCVLAPTLGELLSLPVAEDTSSREAVFAALDELLRSFEMPTVDGWSRAGLYNPISRQVAVGPVPHTRVFSTPTPLTIDPFGSLAVLEEDALLVGLRRLEIHVPSVLTTRNVLAAH